MSTFQVSLRRFASSEKGVGAALAFLTVAVFAVACTNRFAYDDLLYVTDNPHVQAGLTPESITWAWTTTFGSNWHPLTWMSLEADATLSRLTGAPGMQPWIFHLTNVLLHACNTLLLFHVLYRMTAALWRSAMVAALFAVHPLHVESVAWVAERKDVLSTLFWILTLLAYLRYVERPSVSRYLIVVLAFVLGLLSKPMLVTLPFVLLLLDYWPLSRWRVRPLTPDPSPPEYRGRGEKGAARRKDQTSPLAPVLRGEGSGVRGLPWLLWEKAPFFILSAAASVVTWYAQKQGGSVATLERFPVWTRLGNAVVAYCGYIGKMLWPVNLVAFYPHPGTGLPAWQVFGAIAVLVILSFVFLVKLRQYGYLAVGWLWYLGTLVPVIGLVQVGRQAMADRYTYVPFIGLFLLGVWGVADLLGRWQWQKAVAPIAFTLLAIASCLTIAQERYWYDDLTLWGHALRVNEKNPVAHNNYGNQLIKKNPSPEEKARYQLLADIPPRYWDDGNKREEDGLRHYRRALDLDPNYAGAAANVGMELAAGAAKLPLLRSQQQFAEALPFLEKAVRGKPDNAVWQFNLGVVLVQLKQLEPARDHFEKALQADPNNALAHNGLATVLEAEGKRDEAQRHYEAALEVDPGLLIAHNSLAAFLMAKGDLDGTITHLRAIQKIDPKDANVYYSLARAYGQKGRWNEAIECAREAVRLQPSRPLYHCELAYTLYQSGHPQEAKTEYDTASKLNPKWPDLADGEARALASNPQGGRADRMLALEEAEQTCQATQNSEPRHLHTLAIAYAALDRFPEAVKASRAALARATSTGQTDLAKLIEQDLKHFENGQPAERR